MDLQITWQDRNESVDHFEIHRADTPVAFKDLGDPLATVPNGTFSYLDETAIRNEVYYYSIVAVKGTHRVMSQQRAHAAIPNTGPGPQELIYGDADFGIFGITKRLELLSRDQLLDQLPDFYGNRYRDVDEWVKYMWRGRVCFMAAGPMKRDTSWDDYYNAGLVYGTDDEGEYPGGVNQRQVVYRGPYNFRVRLPKWELVPDTDGFNYTNVRSEFAMALGPFVSALESHGMDNYRDRDGDIYIPTLDNKSFYWMWGSTSNTGYARYPLHAELYGGLALSIGDGYSGSITTHQRPSRNSRQYYYGWYPVLELEF